MRNIWILEFKIRNKWKWEKWNKIRINFYWRQKNNFELKKVGMPQVGIPLKPIIEKIWKKRNWQASRATSPSDWCRFLRTRPCGIAVALPKHACSFWKEKAVCISNPPPRERFLAKPKWHGFSTRAEWAQKCSITFARMAKIGSWP